MSEHDQAGLDIKGLIERVERGEITIDGERIGFLLRLCTVLVHVIDINIELNGDPANRNPAEMILECQAALELCDPEHDNEMHVLVGLFRPQLEIVLGHLGSLRERELATHEWLPLTAAMQIVLAAASAAQRSELCRLVRQYP